MQRYLRLCLWQVIFISIVSFQLPVIGAEDGGIRIRGPKSTDAFPYDRYGPITASDTLWKIALTVRPDPSLTVYQVMQALYAKNPQAFKDRNLNHLVEGQYLKIPEISEIRQINPQAAQQKSDTDDAAWAKKVVKKEKPKTAAPVIIDAVKKKDLEQAKSEINVQLKENNSVQQEKLQTIHQDVLDSMDGLQAILKENEQLRARLSSFNDQLTVMQDEVAKGQEIKVQMDDMIAIQQELLAKAEAREQELLFEKQQAELDAQSFTSSIWFMVLMATLPALLIIGVVVLLLKRRKPEEAEKEAPKKTEEVTEAAEPEQIDEPLATEDLSLDNEMSLEDELSLDDELLLDDELSIDIGEDSKDDDLFDDSLDDLDDLEDLESLEESGDKDEQLLDDDVIHLDDELEDLEDIALDSEEVDLLDGGELGQGDLDALLSDLEDDDDEPETVAEEAEELEGGVLDQDLLNDLLDGPDEDSELNEETLAQDSAETANATQEADDLAGEVSDPDDIDALLDSVGGDVAEDSVADDLSGEVSDPDDIDALLDSVGGDAAGGDVADDLSGEVSDPDDIDALLDSVGSDSAADDLSGEVSDPDDIDALLDSVGGDDAAGDSAADDLSGEVSDPDDIDALLDSVGGDSAADDLSGEVSDPDDIDALLDSVGGDNASDDLSGEISDPDDIDALLDPVGGDNNPEDSAATETVDDMSGEVSDPDDIDALLDSIGGDNTPEESAATETVDDMSSEVSDPDDIDALLDSIGGDSSPEESTAAKTVDDVSGEVSDPDDIDALLDSIGGDSSPEESAATETVEDMSAEVSDPDDIDALLDSIGGDNALEGQDNTPEESAATEPADDLSAEVSDPDDIDALLDSIGEDNVSEASSDNEVADEPQQDLGDLNEEVSDPDDIDALLDALDMGDVAAAAKAAEVVNDAVGSDAIEASAEEGNPAEEIESSDKQADANHPNKEAIDNFSEEYVAPFLSMDLSDVQSKEEQETDTANDSDVAQTDDVDDIDALLDAIQGDDDSAADSDDVEANNNETDLSDDEPASENLDELIAEIETPKENQAPASEQPRANEPEDDDLSAILEELDELSADDNVSSTAEEIFDEDVPQGLIDSGADSNIDLELADIDTSPDNESNDDDSSNELSDVDDELDIEALIAEVNDEESPKNDDFDIGDDLALDDLASGENTLLAEGNAESAISDPTQPNEDANKQTDDEVLAALSDDFDETTLSQLLQDEKDEASHVELSPDFTDSNVLADLLAEESEKKEEVAEANEMDDIQELDNLDFDELLANIEEETHQQPTPVEVTDDFDIGDDLALNTELPESPETDFGSGISGIDDILVEEVGADQEHDDIGDDFVSVDSLLSQSQDSNTDNEPYNKENIDVGLGDFPEFSSDGDDDEDEKGMAAKLDLAKVYLEIGDKENAEVILQDVLVDGDEQQQYEARQLLDNF